MRAIRNTVVAGAAVLVAVLLPLPSVAQAALQISTPYPAIAIGPGESATFDLRITGQTGQRVGLRVTRKPRGWPVTLRGGGFVVEGVILQGGGPPDVQLDVDVPSEAEPGDYRIVVRASSGSGSDTLAIGVRVTGGGGGGVELSTDFPLQEGSSDLTYTFDVSLSNNTPQEITFSLNPNGPPGWQVQASPAGQQQAATVRVPGGGSSSVTVDVDPADDAVAGEYPIPLQVIGGGHSAQIDLQVNITGNFALTLTTPDERLNADVGAGRATDVPLVVVNEGTAQLVDVSLSATPPTEWEVTFAPESIPVIEPGQTVDVMATITPASSAIAGDYVVTLSANAAEATSEFDLRTTVKTSGLWGLVGILLIAAALGGLGWVFRRYGRR